MILIDTHAHLNFEVFEDDWKAVADTAVASGVKRIIVPGTDIDSSRRAVKLAEEHDAIFAVVGIHPHHARALLESSNSKHQLSKQIDVIHKLAEHTRVVGIGEVGLDHHVYKETRYKIQDTRDEWEKVKAIQKELLRKQVEIALTVNKPLVLHSREAGEDVLNMIQDSGSKDQELKGVFHCYEGSKKYLRKILAAGFYVSFTGNVTYTFDRAEVAKEVPLDRLLIETDSPYMTPEPYRNERNTPEYVKIVAMHHAQNRGLQLHEVAEQTTKNAAFLFDIAD